MKIAILTHPLGANYGGILQAYALSFFLKNMGHDVLVLNRQSNLPFLYRIIKSILVFFNHSRYNNPRYRELTKFVKEQINYSKPLFTSNQLASFIKRNKINVVIVGSDQVWRAGFATKYGFDYFLNFVPRGTKRLSYAASFGLSKWEYTNEQTHKIQEFLKDFTAVSVREDEGVIFCEKYFDVKAEHVLDPTMLLRADEYASITSSRIIPNNYVFVYWLGSDIEKQKAISVVKDEGKILIDISLRSSNHLISIEDWLSYIKYADYVVTDSFHGCAFSILFQKQFTICSNNSGGNGRLYSLFTMLGINPLNKNIDYTIVNKHLNEQRIKSYNFLNKTLQ